MEKLLLQTRRPDITFQRNGLIRIAAHVVRTLSISPGDTLNIEAIGNEYLLYAVHHDPAIGCHQARCYSTKGRSNNMCAYSVKLSRAFLDILSIPDDRASFAVGQPITTSDGIIKLPIITRQQIIN